MKNHLPDIEKFERVVFRKKNVLALLLSFSIKLMQAKQAGLLFGTNKTCLKFLPPDKWDRGIIHKFNGKGFTGMVLKYSGTFLAKYKGLSPVRLYKHTQYGEKKPGKGIISFVLRHHQSFYEKGIKILIIDNFKHALDDYKENYSNVSVTSYDGDVFQPLPDLKINKAIARQFKARNIVSAYIPDYGAVAFNTVNEKLIEKNKEKFVHEHQLKKRLDILISAIEMASLAYIGLAKGRQAAHIIWRKEKNLRRAGLELQKKARQLNSQKKYLMAVGAVNENQLNMEPVNIPDGVYAFIDMQGSAGIREKLSPRDYLFVLNLCLQIAANSASHYYCRLDNFLGDSVFLENVSVFDDQKIKVSMGAHERLMLMVFALASFFNEIQMLKKGEHGLDTEGRVKKIITDAQVDINFRAGIDIGTALIGPLGTSRRKIVTAIGEAVNNASRLQTSGIPQGIHASENIISILKDACITRDTKIIWKIIHKTDTIENDINLSAIDFFKCYKKFFNLKNKVIVQRSKVSYKEFSQDITYRIKCIPE